ncbi:uncharacterized protein LOC128632941 isoform X2 [Ictalurus punctatus]|uniref:Uncharacterized protein LOC128632941 isoform X2 n=1 Tax=Ictalurus punctatus TaxID=7998 RepID=A0A9F7RI14_ICTPU|nr:uncharacterized protein LOC128632941 isoform X2 [Ictalurus punctatus]
METPFSLYVTEATRLKTQTPEDGTWKLPECIDPTRCTAPRVANAQPSGTLESSYRSGDYVAFRCDRGYEFERRDPYATCADGTWRLPVNTTGFDSELCRRRNPGGVGGSSAELLLLIRNHPSQNKCSLFNQNVFCKSAKKLF